MTTIATDGRSIAADGLVTSNGTIFGTTFAKIAKLKDGRIAGSAGSAFDIEPFQAWLESGGDFPNVEDNFDALVIYPDGSCRSFDGKGRSVPEQVPTACGSGRELAIGAMMAGASPKRAVKIASTRDCCTGGKITTLTVGE